MTFLVSHGHIVLKQMETLRAAPARLLAELTRPATDSHRSSVRLELRVTSSRLPPKNLTVSSVPSISPSQLRHLRRRRAIKSRFESAVGTALSARWAPVTPSACDAEGVRHRGQNT